VLLREYVFSEENDQQFKNHLQKIKGDTSRSLNEFSLICENSVLSNQVEKVKEQVAHLDVDRFDDDSISKYLTLMKLTEELTSGEELNV